jgi:1-acyl-sn-glycerol-3-phosphate acyltransferase
MAYLWSRLVVVPLIALSTAVCAVISNVVALFDSSPPPQLRVAKAWAKSLVRIAGVNVEVEGLEHIDPKASYVFTSNHLSYMDTPVVLANIPAQFLFLAKEELFRIPFMGWHLKRAGHVPVPLENPRAALRTLGHLPGRRPFGHRGTEFVQRRSGVPGDPRASSHGACRADWDA